MAPLSRTLARLELVRAACLALAATVVLAVGAYAFDAAVSRPTPGPLAAALALVAVTGSGLLYAWRLVTGGLGD